MRGFLRRAPVTRKANPAATHSETDAAPISSAAVLTAPRDHLRWEHRHGKPPLDRMQIGSIDDLYRVRRYPDAGRGVWN